MFLIELGSEVKSRISGYKGIVVSRSEHLNGCNRYLVSPQKVNKDGELPDSYWLDEHELEVVVKNKVKKRKDIKKPGGEPSKFK